MEKVAKMVEEITIKRRMTRSVKEVLRKRILLNCLLALVIILYICGIYLVHDYASDNIKNVALKVFSMIFIITTVIVFEIAYRKDSGKIAINGIELLFFSVYTLYISKIYENIDKYFCKVLILMPLYCAIYYFVKSIIMYKKTQKDYQNNLSDVKEIVKEEV